VSVRHQVIATLLLEEMFKRRELTIPPEGLIIPQYRWQSINRPTRIYNLRYDPNPDYCTVQIGCFNDGKFTLNEKQLVTLPVYRRKDYWEVLFYFVRTQSSYQEIYKSLEIKQKLKNYFSIAKHLKRQKVASLTLSEQRSIARKAIVYQINKNTPGLNLGSESFHWSKITLKSDREDQLYKVAVAKTNEPFEDFKNTLQRFLGEHFEQFVDAGVLVDNEIVKKFAIVECGREILGIVDPNKRIREMTETVLERKQAQ